MAGRLSACGRGRAFFALIYRAPPGLGHGPVRIRVAELPLRPLALAGLVSEWTGNAGATFVIGSLISIACMVVLCLFQRTAAALA